MIVEAVKKRLKPCLERRLLFIVVLSILLPFAAYQMPRSPLQVDLGESTDEDYVQGFYHREQGPYDSYRWSRERSFVTLPGFGVNQPLLLALRLNGTRSQDLPAPQVTLNVNGQHLATFTAEKEMKVYEFPLSRKMVGWGKDIKIEIDSDTFVPAKNGDFRELGVILDWVLVRPSPGLNIALSYPVIFVYSVLGGLAFYLLLRRWQILAIGSVAVYLAVLCWGIVFQRVQVMAYLPILLIAGLMICGTAAISAEIKANEGIKRAIASSKAICCGTLFIFFLSLFFLTSGGGPGESIDGSYMAAVAENIALRQDIYMSPEAIEYRHLRGTFWCRNEDGKCYYYKGLIFSAMEAPLFLIGHNIALASNYDRGSEAYRIITDLSISLINSFITALLCVIFFWYAYELYGSEKIALILTFILAVGTIAWVYSKADFSEPLSALLILIIFYSLRIFARKGTISSIAVSGLCLGLLPYNQLGLLAPVGSVAISYFLYLIFQQIKNKKTREIIYILIVYFMILLILMIFFYIYYWSQAHISFQRSIEVYRYLSVLPLYVGLYGFLFSSGKSIFLYSPPLILNLWAWKEFWKSHKYDMIPLFVSSVVSILFYSRYADWYGGVDWGPRYTVPITPLLVLPLGALLKKAGNAYRRRRLSIFLAALLLLGVLVQIGGLSILSGNYWGLIVGYPPEDRQYAIDAINFAPQLSPVLGHWKLLVSGVSKLWRKHTDTFTYRISRDVREVMLTGHDNLDYWFTNLPRRGAPFATSTTILVCLVMIFSVTVLTARIIYFYIYDK